MHRRLFLTSLAAATLPITATAYSPLQYGPASWGDVRANNDRLVLNFRAAWSLTCQIKADLLANILTSSPQYRALTFVDVDWDTFGPSQWTERLGVQRNSTLIAMKDEKEIARLVNEPYERALRRLLDTALAA